MSTPSSDAKYPVVLRFAGMHPSDLKGYEFHRTRKGGDLGHVQPAKSHLNRLLIGTTDWADEAVSLFEARKAENFADQLESLTKRNRKQQILQRIAEGPRDPWRPTRHGPLREVILTANKKWFDAIEYDDNNEIDFQAREKLFEERAVAWLKKTFGDDVVHARADLDEYTYHIHAVIVPWKRVIIGGAERWMLQPSKHDEIKNYQLAQDRAGAWFSTIDLKRGERRKQAFRDAVARGETPPEKRRHVRPAQYRRNEDVRQVQKARELEEQETRAEQREMAAAKLASDADARMTEGNAIIAGAQGITEATLEVCEADDGPRLRAATTLPDGAKAKNKLTRLDRSPRGHKRIAAALSGALKRMRKKAKAAAEAKAKADLAQEFADIEAADTVIVQIAGMLPDRLRAEIAEARRSLSGRIHALRGAISPKQDRGHPKDRGEQ